MKTLPSNRANDVYALTVDPVLLYRDTYAATWFDADDTANRNYGMGDPFIDGAMLTETIPAEIAKDPKAQAWPKTWTGYVNNFYRFPSVLYVGNVFGTMDNVVMPANFDTTANKPVGDFPNFRGGDVIGRYRSELWQRVKDNSVVARRGLSNLQPDWLNRLCANALNKAVGRSLEFRPPYFAYTYPVLDVDVTLSDTLPNGKRTVTKTPVFTGALLAGDVLSMIDPWRKMFAGLEHQIYLYGEGDTVPIGSDGHYTWPLGLRMPQAPTVGNIYAHFIQLYLLELAKNIGTGAITSDTLQAIETNFCVAGVYPESVTTAQVLIGNYVVYAGYGLTYGHPEGNYYARLFQPDGTLNDGELLAMVKDIAAYANRQRQAWIQANQAIYRKMVELAQAGQPIYTLAIDQLTDSKVVVTNPDGTVTDTANVTTVTGGTHEGNVVNAPPKTGDKLEHQDLTPNDADPLKIGSVKVISASNAINAVGGSSPLIPIVSVARDTNPALNVSRMSESVKTAIGADKGLNSELAVNNVTETKKPLNLALFATAALAAFELLS